MLCITDWTVRILNWKAANFFFFLLISQSSTHICLYRLPGVQHSFSQRRKNDCAYWLETLNSAEQTLKNPQT